MNIAHAWPIHLPKILGQGSGGIIDNYSNYTMIDLDPLINDTY